MRSLRRLALLAVLALAARAVLTRLGLFGRAECTLDCACSQGAESCACGHAVCLAPPAGA